MAKIHHRAIYGSGISMKSDFIQNLIKGNAPKSLNEYSGKYGALFSNYTLQKFILEEAKQEKG